jgi:TolB-like protein/tetratricopeptide (TPR) repeat protein
MGEESPNSTVTTPTRAVFLSYASQDVQAARKICDALRVAGIEVWFDQSELRGGDAWDQKIRQQIHDCTLFIPIISSNTASRHEGYFRLEWDLADQRSHMIARNRAFIVPVCLDATPAAGADVPESFQRVQWTPLPAGDTRPEFIQRIAQLLAGVSPTLARVPAAVVAGKLSRLRPVWLAAAVLILASALYLFIQKPWIPTSAPPVASAFNPPAHSIAVLPFVNMSGDKEQEYFSDGLTEELINSLAEIDELQVAARTSAFSFKGTNTDIGLIARKLNVGAVLEGSVRRSGNTVRVTAQLINAVTGFHLWSHSYDRNLGDVLKLETDIAGDVASALKVSLLGGVATKIELGGTHNPAAFDAYLRGRKAHLAAHAEKDLGVATAAYTAAIGLDPNYALAFANRSLARAKYAEFAPSEPEVREGFDEAQSDARKAIELTPDLAEGHLALAYYFQKGSLDFARASEEYGRALALAPGNAQVLRDYGVFAVSMGRIEAGIAAARRAVVLDPLNRDSHFDLGRALYFGRQNQEAIATFQDVLALDPEHSQSYAFRGFTYYALSDFEHARGSCESKPDYWESQECLAITYDKLGRHPDAARMLAKLEIYGGDTAAYQYTDIYAQWGDIPKALEWLQTAVRLRDPGLAQLKVEPLFDPLRKEPRFQAIERELKFPK